MEDDGLPKRDKALIPVGSIVLYIYEIKKNEVTVFIFVS